MRSVCVFCGSSKGLREEYAEQARALGRALARRGLELVFGAGHIGLMGVLAESGSSRRLWPTASWPTADSPGCTSWTPCTAARR
jgi:predicted Rossmann-fold nucleotide-binding protein